MVGIGLTPLPLTLGEREAADYRTTGGGATE